jgi:C-terminal processing protease CtpA/Prc
MFSSSDSILNVDIIRNGTPLNLDIPMVKMREKRMIGSNDVYNMSSDSIGYIHLGNLQLYHVAELKKRLQPAKVLIIDAREYPNGTLLALSPWLIDGEKLFARHNICDKECLCARKRDSSMTLANEPGRYPGTILFITDHSTISQGEFMTLAFMQSTNVIKMGRPTAGSIGVTSQFEIPGEITCKMTTSEVTLPNGSPVQGLGVNPNVKITENEEWTTSDDLIRLAYEYARRIANANTNKTWNK